MPGDARPSPAAGVDRVMEHLIAFGQDQAGRQILRCTIEHRSCWYGSIWERKKLGSKLDVVLVTQCLKPTLSCSG